VSSTGPTTLALGRVQKWAGRGSLFSTPRVPGPRCNRLPTLRPPMPETAAPSPPAAHALRWFGRFQLLGLLGKSERTMAWRVADPRAGQQLMLVLPRVQPADAAAVEHWTQTVRRAARLAHPNLAPVLELGVHDGWPFAAYDPGDASSLADRLAAQGLPAAEVAALGVQALQGLAYAHDGGAAHHDLQGWLLLITPQGRLRVVGLEVAGLPLQGEVVAPVAQAASDADALRGQREAAQRDVLALGLLLHHALAGRPALDEADCGRAIGRLPPLGREGVRLPWGQAPIPDALRAIVDRATSRQERQRYRNARTLARALEGWLQTDAAAGQGPLALLLDRLHRVGLLPASPGGAERAARLALMERQHTAALAEVVLQDLALAFELLRIANRAQGAGNGPVLTVRRAIGMVGVEGVRRAARALRPWPGMLSEEGAAAMARLTASSQHAGRVALALRPPGYDAEVVFLVAQLQNLGRLVVQYHFAEEAQQIRRLMQPAPSPRAGEPEEAGMSEDAASFAVLGADTEAIGLAVARHWGLDDPVLHMIRRQPLARPVRAPESDDEMLRTLASCAHEAVDATMLPARRVLPALQRVAQRYARALDVDLRALQAALHGRSQAVGVPDTAPARL
jgi:eukaryotic-like serine/threonine-protein kinase